MRGRRSGGEASQVPDVSTAELGVRIARDQPGQVPFVQQAAFEVDTLKRVRVWEEEAVGESQPGVNLVPQCDVGQLVGEDHRQRSLVG